MSARSLKPRRARDGPVGERPHRAYPPRPVTNDLSAALVDQAMHP